MIFIRLKFEISIPRVWQTGPLRCSKGDIKVTLLLTSLLDIQNNMETASV